MAREYGCSPQGTFWLEIFLRAPQGVLSVHVVDVGIESVVGWVGVGVGVGVGLGWVD